MAFTSSLQKGQIPIGCPLCEKGSKIQWKCCDCDMLMCTLCKDNVHSKFKNFSTHRITDIKNLGQENSNENIGFCDIKCKHHTDQPCCLICATCKQLVCLKCILKTHNGHKFVDEEEYRTKRKKVRDNKPRIERTLNRLAKMKEYIIKVKEFEFTKYNKRKTDILAQKTAVKKHVEELLNGLDDKWKKFNLDLERRQNKVKNMEETLLKLNNTVDKLMKSKEFVHFIDESNKLESLLDDEDFQITEYTSMPEFLQRGETKDIIEALKIVDRTVEQDKEIEIEIVREFTSELENIHLSEACSDGSLWIHDTKLDLLQHIEIKGNKIQELSRLNTVVWDMAAIHSNELLISNGESILKQVSKTGGMKNSAYCVAPLTPTAVHVTKRNTVIIAAKNPGQAFPTNGRRVVIMMDQKGKRIAEYELDSNKKPIFTSPIGITSTSEGNIFVVDRLEYDCRGRVVVLSPAGDVISTYSGHSDINRNIQFTPTGIITTTLNNIVVVDTDTHTIHILDSEGHFITYYSTKDLEIIFPYSAAVSATTENLFIGCRAPVGSSDTFKSKLYAVKFSGF